MGGSKDYLEGGGFAEQHYQADGTTPNGIKLLKKYTDNYPANPSFSNTANTMYASRDRKTGEVNQVSVYGNASNPRAKFKDIDIDHVHRNPDGRIFKANEIHVHYYVLNEQGIPIRSPWARLPSKKEQRLLMEAKYGRKNKRS